MVITIDQALDEPIYLQIRSQIVAAVARGELVAGDQLPSVRSLASDLGVNLHTVNKAYAVLRDEGHITMRGRSGAIVSDYRASAPASRREEGLARIADTLEQAALEYRAKGGNEQGFLILAAQAAGRAFADARPSRGQPSEAPVGTASTASDSSERNAL